MDWMPQEGNSEQELTRKKDAKEKIAWVDFLDPGFLIGSLWRGAKLPEIPKALRLTLYALLFAGIAALVSLIIFGEQLPSGMQPWPQIRDVLITAIIFLLIWLFVRIKKR